MPSEFRVEQRKNRYGESVWGRQEYRDKQPRYSMCAHCNIPAESPEGCGIQREIEKIERFHRVTLATWECPQFMRKKAGTTEVSHED
jgi:hypothetical protein